MDYISEKAWKRGRKPYPDQGTLTRLGSVAMCWHPTKRNMSYKLNAHFCYRRHDLKVPQRQLYLINSAQEINSKRECRGKSLEIKHPVCHNKYKERCWRKISWASASLPKYCTPKGSVRKGMGQWLDFNPKVYLKGACGGVWFPVRRHQ